MADYEEVKQSDDLGELLKRAEGGDYEAPLGADTLEADDTQEHASPEDLASPYVRELLGGSWRPWLRRHYTHERLFFMFFCLVVLLLVSMWNTYYKSEVRLLDQEEQRLMDLRYRSLFTTAELVRLQRISNIERSIQTLGLPLEHSTHPPYEVIDTLGGKR